MTLQLTLSPEDRLPSDQLAEYALKEYERLQQEAPPLSGGSVILFNQKYYDTDSLSKDPPNATLVVNHLRKQIVIEIISIALPVCINAVPAKTKTISG